MNEVGAPSRLGQSSVASKDSECGRERLWACELLCPHLLACSKGNTGRCLGSPLPPPLLCLHMHVIRKVKWYRKPQTKKWIADSFYCSIQKNKLFICQHIFFYLKKTIHGRLFYGQHPYVYFLNFYFEVIQSYRNCKNSSKDSWTPLHSDFPNATCEYLTTLALSFCFPFSITIFLHCLSLGCRHNISTPECLGRFYSNAKDVVLYACSTLRLSGNPCW